MSAIRSIVLGKQKMAKILPLPWRGSQTTGIISNIFVALNQMKVKGNWSVICRSLYLSPKR